MAPTLSTVIKCRSCNKTENLVIKHYLDPKSITDIGWDFIYDTSQGLEIAPYCPECMKQAKALAKQLQDLVKLEHWQFASLARKQ